MASWYDFAVTDGLIIGVLALDESGARDMLRFILKSDVLEPTDGYAFYSEFSYDAKRANGIRIEGRAVVLAASNTDAHRILRKILRKSVRIYYVSVNRPPDWIV